VLNRSFLVQSAGFNGAPVFVAAALWFLNVVAVALIYCRKNFRTYSSTAVAGGRRSFFFGFFNL
jgi:hypothetical protein